MRLFDAHCHLNLPEFDPDRDQLIAEMRERGVAAIVVGVDYETSARAVALADAHDHLYAAIGLHPVDNPEEAFDIESFRDLAEHGKVVAVGECGLDYYRLSGDAAAEKLRQKEIFEAQVKFALESALPLMIHARPSKGSMDAYEDVLGIVEGYKARFPALAGNAHFFAGTPDIAARFAAIGFTMSFSGVITFAREYDETIRSLPLSAILAETDAPFAAPEPYRGKRNSPLHVGEVIKTLGRIRGENEEILVRAAAENARRLFRID